MSNIKTIATRLVAILPVFLLSACNYDGDCELPPITDTTTDVVIDTTTEPDVVTAPAECNTRFCKIGSDGQRLAADASAWSCVEDRLLDTFWEVKTDDGGLRDKDWTYAATGDAGACGDTLGAGVACSSTAYVAAVNAAETRPCGPQRRCRLPSHFDLLFMSFPADFFPPSQPKPTATITGLFTAATASYAPDTSFFPNHIADGFYFNTTDNRQVRYGVEIPEGTLVDAITLEGMAPFAPLDMAGHIRLLCE